MTWQLLFDNWHKIMGLILALTTVLVSPIVVIRWIKTRSELMEIKTFVQKNEIIRAEISQITSELSTHRQQIATLEVQLLQEQLKTVALEAENQELKSTINRLKIEIQKLKSNDNGLEKT